MSFDEKKGIVVASGFKLQAETPLDARQVVEDITERNELVTIHAAVAGLRVFVKSEKKSYVYNGTGWDPLVTGSGYIHPTGDGYHHVPATGTSNNGKVLMAGDTAGSEQWKTLTRSNISDFPSTLPNPNALTFTGAVKDSYDGSAEKTINIPETSPVANDLIIKLNGGTEEGTNQFTFDGSEGKNVNITPAAIGAAAASHGIHVTYGTSAPKANGAASAGTANSVSRSDHVHPAQTTVSGNAGSATKLATARTIDGVSFDGTSNINHYGLCGTGADTAAKVVSCTGFTLGTGAKITVKFTVTNTAANPTLNVNGTGAKAIYYRGAAIPTGYLAANRTYTFVYNGTQYELIGDINTDTDTKYNTGTATTPGLTKLYTSTGTATDGTMTQKAITDALGGKAASSHTHTKSQITDMPTTLPNPQSMVIKLNGGTEEGTNQFTYTGSAAKSVNITPSSIGAAAASHGTHVTYGSGAPKANGTASAGTANSVSRSDHVHPAQTTVSGNAGSATKLATARSIDGVSFDGTSNITHYGSCSTAAGTAAKVVSCTGFTLGTGAKITVKFTVTNTAANPTLNVNNTGAKAIYYRGAAISTGYLAANRTYTFVYNGTQYELIGDIDTSTSYNTGTATTPGLTKLYTGTGTNTDGTMTQKAITDALGGKASSSHTHTKSQITDMPTTLPNPQSMVIKLNGGGTEGTNMFTYTGSTAKSLNITPSSIGAAAASHGTHVTYGSGAPKANGTASAGSASTVSRSDHVHPAQTTVSGNAGSATKLATARTIDGVSFNGTANITHYGSCSTAAATAAKTVSCTGFTLATGAKITVKFTVTNTAANPTLNVNNTGAKAIFYRGSAISAGYLASGRVYTFLYDGTNYELIGDINTDSDTKYNTGTATTAGLTKLYTGTGSATDGTMTQKAITDALGGKASTSHTHTKSQITDMPTTLPNPQSMVIKLNGGSTEGTNLFTYTGSTAKSINITPASIGAATSGHTHNYLPLSGGTITGNLKLQKGSHVHVANGTAGTTGYVRVATIKITGSYQNMPISFEVYRRRQTRPTKLYLTFVGAEGTDPSIDHLLYEGAGTTNDFAIVKSSSSNWNLYIQKAEGYDNIGIAEYHTNFSYMSGIQLTWTNIQETLPAGAIKATKISDASSTPASLTLQFNGTTKATFNGSAAATVNITPSAIGAAASSHTHTKSQITDMPTTLPNPQSMVIKLNGGGTEGTNMFTYTGSTAKSINITASSIGAAAASHGTHVTYGTSAPKANGTASAGTANSVSRSDHVHPAQTTVSGNAGSATKLATARTIDGVSFNGTANITHYGSCSTAAGTAAKVVSCTGFTLGTGAKITVKFTVTNTAANPTLNVNNTGAKAIYYRGSAISTGHLAANRTYTFVYNGTQYELIGDINTDTDTKYNTGTATTAGITKLYTGTGSATDGTMTQKAITSALGGKASTSHTHTKSQITDMPTTLPNPQSMVIKLNGGSTEGTNLFTYTGSTAKSINITPASIGAAGASHGIHVAYGTEAPRMNGSASAGSASSVSRSDHVHPLQANVPGNAGSATRLVTPRLIDGVSFNGTANITHYGSCSTAAGTGVKTVSCAGFVLTTGAKITVKFTVTNTAANPTLNVNNTGAKAIYYRGATIPTGYLAANRTFTFVYNGAQYELIGDISTGGTASSANRVPVPVGTVLFSTSSTTTFFSSCFGGTWVVDGNLKALIDGTTEKTLYMFRKTAA